MKNICVVTGGGSGMGFEAAKLLGRDHKIILMGRTVSKLEHAIQKLTDSGIEAEAYPGDTSNRESVKKLAAYAAEQGNVDVVIHAAGVAPSMTDASHVIEINAIGTIIIDEEFSKIMQPGSCILNVSSSSAYMLPASMIPTQTFPMSLESVDAFRTAICNVLNAMPEERRGSMAYPFSKSFVVWYTERMAVRLAPKGIRVISIAPGVIETPLSASESSSATLAMSCPLKRIGNTEEIAKMMDFMIRDSYLDGVDILYDGGLIASMHARADSAKQ
jgi:NAD(P)-dependent dehydrogenase (short-subunit alcohol dehydrogenase family)